jgi:hypothetical protein
MRESEHRFVRCVSVRTSGVERVLGGEKSERLGRKQGLCSLYPL